MKTDVIEITMFRTERNPYFVYINRLNGEPAIYCNPTLSSIKRLEEHINKSDIQRVWHKSSEDIMAVMYFL